jgi:hypothetical protein
MAQPDSIVQKVFFLHIPKTGGQTLATRLKTAYPDSRADILGEDFKYPEGTSQLLSKFESCDFIERHISGPVLQDLNDISVLTVIREPIKQIVSSYLHIKREPRNSLCRAANKLSPSDFFHRFGDFFYNRQSSYLVGAFFQDNGRNDRFSFLISLMHGAVQRVKWMVPTEHINDFIPLWCAENGKHICCDDLDINVASRSENIDVLTKIVRDYPDLYAIDLMLWRMAHKRFAQYKSSMWRELHPFSFPDNSSKAFSNGDTGVWLRSGWYPPEITSDGDHVWWSGPSASAQVSYRRSPAQNELSFAIEVVCGIAPSQITIYDESMSRELPTRLEVVSGASVRLIADLNGLDVQGTLNICVPEVWAPIMVTENDDNIDRKSFAARNWRID